jgi:hypothetical protein
MWPDVHAVVAGLSLPVHTTAPFRRNLTLQNPDLWQVLDGEEIVRHE